MSNKYDLLERTDGLDLNDAKRAAQRLRRMRRDLQSLRKRKSDSTLLLATWNIRDFDSNEFKQGPRLPETFFYIAEIISCFDLVALQEVNRDLSALDRVMEILGSEWQFIATDTTEGVSGNGERMAFVYNTEKVRFRNIAGEIVLPNGQLIVSPKRTGDAGTARGLESAENAAIETAIDSGLEEAEYQFARTPFVVSFESGWFRFNLCTVHIYYGSASGKPLRRRIDEIRKLVKFMAERQDRENRPFASNPTAGENYILLGDFNVVSPEHETMEALRDRGFVVPPAIDGDKVRTPEDHFYDQIAVRVSEPSFRVITGGMVDMYKSVFRANPTDMRLYASCMPPPTEKEKDLAEDQRYRKWRTWQMSDHRPLWIEIDTDYANKYLEQFNAT
ncbi:MAG: endonuclease/exonuclease/phosphatase family protein [Thermomicrobiales bacterium]|nr:endonuclease/exonuclease/phosphatase family protein [Thermomicrobiales bacterium]